MGKVLYRKYRPMSLDDVVGQAHVTSILRNSIERGAISHAYLLTGPKGTGKTSIARIIAHTINNLPYEPESNHIDIIEIDAASNNGVEDVRELREKIHIAPSEAAKKIYIIDEVHMLSKAAFNALLKTLEEPPSHIVFIFATTDAEKLPQTIISRVQRFNFHAVPLDAVVGRLQYITEQEGITIEKSALHRIAEYGEGSFRDSIGLLDQLRHIKDSEAPITVDDVNSILGATDHSTIEALIAAHDSNDLTALAHIIRDFEQQGVGAGMVMKQLIDAILADQNSLSHHMQLLDNLTSTKLTSHPYARLLVAISRDISVGETIASPKPAPKKLDTHADTPEKSNKLQKQKKQHSSPSKFSWSSFIDAIADENEPAAALLRKYEYSLENNILTIYAKQRFQAKRIESPRYQKVIHEALKKIGCDDIKLSIKETAKPSSNSSVATVTAIMGGGEEVSVDGN